MSLRACLPLPLLPLSVLLLSMLLMGGCSDSVSPAPADDEVTDTVTGTQALPTKEDATSERTVEPEDRIITLYYRCEDGLEFSVLLNDHRISLTLPQEVIELYQQPAASGAFFRGEGWQLHSKNTEALLINDELTRECHEVQHQALLITDP